MVKIQSIQQKARIILNSEDAQKTLTTDYLPSVIEAPRVFDASVNMIVDTANDQIFINGHGLKEVEKVTYSTSGTVIGGLTNNTQYDVEFVSDDIIKLRAAGTTNVVNLTSVGTGNHTLTSTATFLTSQIGNRNIRIDNHTFETGMKVIYSSTGAALEGLENNKEYYAIRYGTNTVKLAETVEEALASPIVSIQIEAAEDLAGVTHSLKKVVSFNVEASTVVDTAREQINIPGHGLTTADKVQYKTGGGTAVVGLTNNYYYNVIYVDDDSIKLALDADDALAGKAVNITGVGTGNAHSLTKIIENPISVCKNYKFKLDNLPLHLNDKCKLAVTDFVWARNMSGISCKSIGGVYCKSLSPVDTYMSQGYYKGNLLVSAHFGESISYRSADIQQSGIPISNGNHLLQNGLDIYVDSKKMNRLGQDIEGNINDDPFSLTLVVYEIDEYEYVSSDLNANVRHMPNVKMI